MRSLDMAHKFLGCMWFECLLWLVHGVAMLFVYYYFVLAFLLFTVEMNPCLYCGVFPLLKNWISKKKSSKFHNGNPTPSTSYSAEGVMTQLPY